MTGTPGRDFNATDELEACNECGEPMEEYNGTEHCEECNLEFALDELQWEEMGDEC